MYTLEHTHTTHIHIYQLISIIIGVGILIHKYIYIYYTTLTSAHLKTIAPNILLNYTKYQSKNKTKHTSFNILDFLN